MSTWKGYNLIGVLFLLCGALSVTAVSSTTSQPTSPPEWSSLLTKPWSWTVDLLWQSKAALRNRVSSPGPDYIHLLLTVPTLGRCAMECHHRAWCASFFFSASDTNNTCLLDSVALQSSLELEPSPGFRYFLPTSDWCDEKEGFMFYPGERFCVRVFTAMVTDWDTAVTRCREEGLELVVPANTLQVALLLAAVNRTRAFRKRNHYLGIARPREEWGLPWTGGVPRFVDVHNRSVNLEILEDRFWVHNNPNNQKDMQNCVQIDRKRGNQLNDLGCTYNNYYICQKIWA